MPCLPDTLEGFLRRNGTLDACNRGLPDHDQRILADSFSDDSGHHPAVKIQRHRMDVCEPVAMNWTATTLRLWTCLLFPVVFDLLLRKR